MIQWIVFAVFCIGTAAFCCWFAHVPSKDDHISGDWRHWGFEDDPLAPAPKPDTELVGK